MSVVVAFFIALYTRWTRYFRLNCIQWFISNWCSDHNGIHISNCIFMDSISCKYTHIHTFGKWGKKKKHPKRIKTRRIWCFWMILLNCVKRAHGNKTSNTKLNRTSLIKRPRDTKCLYCFHKQMLLKYIYCDKLNVNSLL